MPGDDGVGEPDGRGEPPLAAGGVGAAAVVRVAEEDGVVEVEDEVARVPAEDGRVASPASSLRWRITESYRGRLAELRDPGDEPPVQPLAGQRPAGR